MNARNLESESPFRQDRARQSQPIRNRELHSASIPPPQVTHVTLPKRPVPPGETPGLQKVFGGDRQRLESRIARPGVRPGPSDTVSLASLLQRSLRATERLQLDAPRPEPATGRCGLGAGRARGDRRRGQALARRGGGIDRWRRGRGTDRWPLRAASFRRILGAAVAALALGTAALRILADRAVTPCRGWKGVRPRPDQVRGRGAGVVTWSGSDVRGGRRRPGGGGRS